MLGEDAVILSEKMVNPSQLTDDSMISFIDLSFDFPGKLFFEILVVGYVCYLGKTRPRQMYHHVIVKANRISIKPLLS